MTAQKKPLPRKGWRKKRDIPLVSCPVCGHTTAVLWMVNEGINLKPARCAYCVSDYGSVEFEEEK